MLILAIESTCDETAAAVIDDQLQVRGEVVASQDALHQSYGGVVPEIASRAHVERVLPVVDQALRRAEVSFDDLDAIAVANAPGLAGSLLVGLSAAKALCVAANLPLIAVNHLEAHIYACQIATGKNVFPCVGLIVSGGHTNLYHCRSPLDFELLGTTIDDAAGEAFDKVASMLGLPYPGGPAIEQAARSGNPRAFRFPRSLLNERDRLQFSFSGLKTAVRYQISRERPPQEISLEPGEVANLAASFQEAAVEVLVAKSLRAVEMTGTARLCVGGGVAANSRFRDLLAQRCSQQSVELVIAPMPLCTDNAVMGGIAFERLKSGGFADLELDISAGVVRDKRT